MAKRTKSRGRKQVRLSSTSKELESSIAAGEKKRLANERARVRRDKIKAKADAKRHKQYLKDLAKLETTGLYQPKLAPELDRGAHILTRYRRGRINRTIREAGDLLRPDKFFFIPVKPAQKEKGIVRAQNLNMITSKKGIFVERNGFERAKLRRSKFSPKNELEIQLSYKAKSGINKGKIIDEIIPLAPLDQLLSAEKRLRKAANAFGPLQKNERLAFIISTNGYDGYSYNTYDSIDGLIRDLHARYIRSEAAKIFLFRHITIRKTTLTTWRTEAAPFRTRKRKIRKVKVYGAHRGK